jgi:hypothetical protein
MVLGRWDHIGVPVTGAPGRHVDDAARPGAPAAFEQIDGAQDVDLGVEGWIRDRSGHGGLRREMNDGVGRLGAEDVVHRRAADVDYVEPRRRIDLLSPAGTEVVHHGHLVARFDTAVDHVGADESRAARDEDLHGAAL